MALSNVPLQPPMLPLERRELPIMTVLIVIVAVVVILVLALWVVFNGLVKRRNRTEEAWSEIDVELKRRHDLIPNLVTAVRAYASHERGTFEAVTLARSQAVSAAATGDPSRIASAESSLSGALRSLFAVAENYPQLRAVESFVQLQESLTSTEDKVEYARRYYNTSARDYNIRLQTFPQNLIAEVARVQKCHVFRRRGRRPLGTGAHLHQCWPVRRQSKGGVSGY